MNQLQNLLHDALILTNHVAKCALINFEEHKLASASIGYQPDEETVETIVESFEDLDKIREYGLDIEDVNYKCIRADQDAIYTRETNRGVILVKTNQYILMGIFEENMFPSVCVEAVEKLAEYFKSKDK